MDNEDWPDSAYCVPSAWGLVKTRGIDWPVEIERFFRTITICSTHILISSSHLGLSKVSVPKYPAVIMTAPIWAPCCLRAEARLEPASFDVKSTPGMFLTFFTGSDVGSDRDVAYTVPLVLDAYFLTKEAPRPLDAPTIKISDIFAFFSRMISAGYRGSDRWRDLLHTEVAAIGPTRSVYLTTDTDTPVLV